MQPSRSISQKTTGFVLTAAGCATLIAAGIALIATGRTLPVYTIAYARAEAIWGQLCGAGELHPAGMDRYAALFGWHYALMNAGTTLAFAGATGLAIAAALRATVPAGKPWLRTPSRRWMFLGMGLIALALMTAGMVSGLTADQQRLYFPACADSIAIPIFGLYVSLILLTPILLLAGFGITRFFGQLPVPLTQWDAARPRRSWAVTLIFAAAMLGGTAVWLAGIFSSDQVAPSSMLVLYLLASTRAALLAPRS